MHQSARPGDSTLEARIASYELAFRMQSAAPEAVDSAKSPPPPERCMASASSSTDDFGRKCLLARRLVERGVRFIQLYSGTNVGRRLGHRPHRSDRFSHEDGRQDRQADRGTAPGPESTWLLDSTLVVWSGEFGRTPLSQGQNGRDHHPYGFSMWMAGGGVKGGQVLGATDEFGVQAAEMRVDAHDVNATLLRLMGLDHKRLTYFYQGRDQRLTDVHGEGEFTDG